jgi:DNA-binding transcriptional MerR regulator
MDEYKTGKVAAWVKPPQHENTIRTWSGKYADYLSKNANAARRRYSFEDIRVLATIADYRQQGLSFDAIEQALKEGKRLADDEMPPEPDIEDDEARAAVSIVRIPEGDYTLQLALLNKAIEERELELREVREQLASEKADKAKLQERVTQLEREIGLAQGELKGLDRERKSSAYWLTILVTIIILVIIIASGVVYFISTLGLGSA